MKREIIERNTKEKLSTNFKFSVLDIQQQQKYTRNKTKQTQIN